MGGFLELYGGCRQLRVRKKSVKEAERIGFQDYLKEHYSLERINELYEPRELFQDYKEIYIPPRNNPGYKLCTNITMFFDWTFGGCTAGIP